MSKKEKENKAPDAQGKQEVKKEVDLLASIELSMDQIQIPVLLKSKSETLDCVLVEATGDARDAYMSKAASRARVDEEGKSLGLSSFDGLIETLLCRCLYINKKGMKPGDFPAFIESSDDFELMPLAKVRSLPSRIQQSLFDRVHSISGMDAKATDKAKNG